MGWAWWCLGADKCFIADEPKFNKLLIDDGLKSTVKQGGYTKHYWWWLKSTSTLWWWVFEWYRTWQLWLGLAWWCWGGDLCQFGCFKRRWGLMTTWWPHQTLIQSWWLSVKMRENQRASFLKDLCKDVRQERSNFQQTQRQRRWLVTFWRQ